MKAFDRGGQQEIRERIYVEQVNYLYANAAIGLLTSYINSAVLAYLLWQRVATDGLLLWLGVLWLFTLLRYGLILSHHRAEQRDGYQPHWWGRLFIITMLVAGLIWGSIAILAYPTHQLSYEIFTVFVLGGMAAGASSSLTALYAVPLLFNVTTMLPAILRLIHEGGQIQSAMAIMMSLFLVMMLVFARRSHNMFIATIKLGFEKRQLEYDYERTRDDLQQEVTGRALAEASLRDSQNLLRTIVENAPLIIFAADSRGQIVLSEGKGLELLNLGPGELVGKYIHQVYSQEPAVLESLSRAFDGEECTCLREVQGRLFDVICTPMRDADNQVFGIIGIETDVTEKLKVERIRRDLISTVSHELRTPLTSIIGALQLLHGGVLDTDADKRNEMLENALRNSQRLIRLVNDILDIDKLESGKMRFDIRPLDLAELIGQALDANRSYAGVYDVGLQAKPECCDVQLQVDAERFLQVMNNLLSNAIKHSPAGGVVTVQSRCLSHEFKQRPGSVSKVVRIEVLDNGPGIPESARANLFDKFTQVEADNSPVQGGTGLGLSIAKAIVERMAGEIGFEVDEVHGQTCFYIILPLT